MEKEKGKKEKGRGEREPIMEQKMKTEYLFFILSQNQSDMDRLAFNKVYVYIFKGLPR